MRRQRRDPAERWGPLQVGFLARHLRCPARRQAAPPTLLPPIPRPPARAGPRDSLGPCVDKFTRNVHWARENQLRGSGPSPSAQRPGCPQRIAGVGVSPAFRTRLPSRLADCSPGPGVGCSASRPPLGWQPPVHCTGLPLTALTCSVLVALLAPGGQGIPVPGTGPGWQCWPGTGAGGQLRDG